MKKQVKYNLVGYMIVTNWYGYRGWKKLDITTDQKGLEEIEKNPLQDYIQFGVRSVDCVYFDVYKTEIYEKDDRVITIEYKEPIKTIEAGTYSLTKDEEEYFEQDYDYAIITY